MVDCTPDNTQLGNLVPTKECEDCTDPANQCNCGIDDIIWTAAVNSCMASLGLATGQTLTQQLTIVYNLLCANASPTHVPCANVDVPGTYTNMNYVGAEYTGTYLNALPGDFPNQYGIIINGITHDFGSTPDQATFLARLNALALATFAYVGNNLVGTGYVTFGNVLIAGGDDGHITPTNVATGNNKTLCDFAGAVNAEFGTINSEITTLQNQSSGTIYSNNTAVVLDNTTGNLQGFGIPINTLANNGDSLLINFSLSSESLDGIAHLYIGNSSNFAYLPLLNGSDTYIGNFRLTRISATTVILTGSFKAASNFFGAATVNSEFISNGIVVGAFTVADLTGNIVNIQLTLPTNGGQVVTSNYLTVDKLTA